MSKYIKIPQAAEYLSVTPQLVYKQIRRYVIKAKKIDGVTHTTTEWLDEYEKGKDTHKHARYKYRPITNEAKGEYGIASAAEILGVDRMYILNLITRGKISASRKGSYYVISQETLNMLSALKEQKQA